MAKQPYRGQPIRSGPEFVKLINQRWDQLRITAEGATIIQTENGFHIVVDQKKDIGFWTKITDEATDEGPGVYEHIQQYVAAYPELDPVTGEIDIFDDNEVYGVASYRDDANSLIYPLIEVNGAKGLARDKDGVRIKNDDGSDKDTYVWCWLGWNKNGNGVFLFDHQNADNNTPTIVGFEYTFKDRDPGFPTFIAKYLYQFPSENDAPISVDPATGDPLQDPDTGAYEHCVAGDYFVVTDDTFLFPMITTGSLGFAEYDDTYDTWDCVFCQQVSLLATAFINNQASPSGIPQSTDGMTGDLVDVPITSFRIMGFSPFNGTPTSFDAGLDEYVPPTAAYNAYGLMGMHNDRVLLGYDAEDEQWVILNVQHHRYYTMMLPEDYDPAQADEAMIRVKTDGKTLEARMARTAIQINIPPDWKDLITGTKCGGT